MVCGIVDMGANSIRLSIYRIEEGEAKLLINKKETAGLSSYVKNGKLSKKGMERAAAVLSGFKEILVNFGITDYYVIATASLRNILNTEEAVEYISESSGMRVDVLPGDEEAKLGFSGAFHSAGIKDGLLLDIGGGSTEIVDFKDSNISMATSLPVGSLNLYLKHVRWLFPTGSMTRDIRHDVKNELSKIQELSGLRSESILGIGGTIRAAAKLNNDLFKLPPENNEISLSNLEKLLEHYKKPDGLALRILLRMAPERVHTIIPGLIVLKTVAEFVGADKITANSFSIREGYLYSRVLTN